MLGGSGEPHVAVAPLRLRRAFAAVMAALVVAVGASASAGLIGIAGLHQTLSQAVQGDAKTLVVATHVRRLFRSELVLVQQLRTSPPGERRAALEDARQRLRSERAARLGELERLLADQERQQLEVLRQQHAAPGLLVEEDDQPWEHAVASILATTEARLAGAVNDSARAYVTATALVIGGSLLAVALGVGLGASALRRIRRASDALWTSQEQLRQAQRLEAIGRLAGGVAHDFNNLLTVIRGHASLLEQEVKSGGSGREDLDSILSTVDRAAGLTRQLLVFSRRQEIQCEVVDLGELVGGMRKLLSRVLGEGVTLSVRTDPEPVLCRVDPTQIEQILMNLAVNAAQAMPRGGRFSVSVEKVRVVPGERWERSIEPGPHAQLTVSDDGIGMPREVQRRAFEPFFTTKPAGEGTGLGLAVVHGAVTKQGGAIELSSEEGVGTTFRIVWPIVEAQPGTRSTVPRLMAPAAELPSARAVREAS